jgi:2-methylisocitrate lyase-like PEP mutase family enzyme
MQVMDPSTSPTARFRELHASGTFVMPNPWDVASARILAGLGFSAVATTSAGFAAALGRTDYSVTREELVGHARQLAAAVDVPLNVDAENGLAETPHGVATTASLLGESGAAGFSIEDWDPQRRELYPKGLAVERISAAAEANSASLVLTARAENHLRGVTDLDDTIARLDAYRAAGADAVYAPGLVDLDDIARVVGAIDAPVNVLLLPDGPSVSELAAVGVRRVSVGHTLALTAYSALVRAGQELLTDGTARYVITGSADPNPFALLRRE